MYIDLDILIKIGWIVLIAAGAAALIYLALVFKSLISTANELTKTLEKVQTDLEKLEGPLATVDAVSRTVDELNDSVRKTANSALGVVDDGLNTLKTKFAGKKAETAAAASRAEAEKAAPDESAEFVPIVQTEAATAEVPAEETVAEEVIVLGDSDLERNDN